MGSRQNKGYKHAILYVFLYKYVKLFMSEKMWREAYWSNDKTVIIDLVNKKIS